MNRAIRFVAILGSLGVAAAVAQEPREATRNPAQDDVIERVVAEMRAAEAALKSVRVELTTHGVFPAGLEVSTAGTLHVLRGEQRMTRATVRLRYSNGLTGLMDSARTADGITIYKDDPAFGEVFFRVSPEVTRDVEWAGEVLDRSDLPGMSDARADAPLGSTMVEGLLREFALAETERRRRGDDDGVWLAGERRPGLGDTEAELPLADRVELFVRGSDRALLEVVHYRGDAAIQRIDVQSLAVDVEIPAATFEVDGRGQPLRDVAKYVPLWTQIQDVIRQAEEKLVPEDLPEGEEPPPECVRPSRR